MTDERDTPAGGAPVEETESTPTQVQAAVERAVVTPAPVTPEPASGAAEASPQAGDQEQQGASDGGADHDASGAATAPPAALTASPAVPAAPALSATATPEPVTQAHETRIQPATELPSAVADQSASDIFAAAAASSAAARAVTGAESPSVHAAPATSEPVVDSPVRDGEIRISADHPMATLYMQTPMPPDPRGNRVAGFWISLLASATFALVYAGCLALVLAPQFPPSTYLTEGLVPSLLLPSFLIPVIVFLFSNMLLALIAGRSGWWAHIIGSLFVGGLTAVATVFSVMYELAGGLNQMFDDLANLRVATVTIVIGFLVGILAREVSMWFGAWIGSRGRKVTRLNLIALDEYEAALADVQNPQVAPANTL